MLKIFDSYINFIQEKNKEKLSSSKTFYLLIKSPKTSENLNQNIFLSLKENYFKIKDALARCGNNVLEIKEKKEIEKIIKSFFYN